MSADRLGQMDMQHTKQVIVSVVIPTRNRADLVMRAVKTAFAQSFTNLEVLVIVDGPDEPTMARLHQIQDHRLRIILLPETVGGADARNAGVCAARGEWIAFLDDDDEWLPSKLEKQWKVAVNSAYKYPIVTSAIIGRTPSADFLWPRKPPAAPLCEYLFARNSLTQGEGLIVSSMVLTRRELLLIVPFRKNLRKHQDWDWLLRAVTNAGVGIEFVAEPLAIWNIEEGRKTVSTTSDWKYSLCWLRENKSLVTPRAYAGFLATQVSVQASREGDWTAFFPLLKEAIREGRPKPIDILLYLGIWLVPQALRRGLRRCLDGCPAVPRFVQGADTQDPVAI